MIFVEVLNTMFPGFPLLLQVKLLYHEYKRNASIPA